MREPLIVVEHLEPKLSEWLIAEYRHAAEIAGGNFLITNVKRDAERRKLSEFCEAKRESVGELFRPEELLVLDPRAERKLRRKDFSKISAVVVGGILGDDPPLGRTEKLLTSRLAGCRSRNIGRDQFSIDGSVFIAKEIMKGKELEEIPVAKEIEIPVEEGCSIVLPFAYPLVGGKPLISPELLDYLRKRGTEF